MRFSSIHLSFWLVGLFAGLLGQQAAAQVSAPTKGGGVSVTRITATTMDLKFGTTGTGQGRVVALAATKGGMPVPLTPVDGESYTAASTYGQGAKLGQGYVVYNGSEHTATVTGLQPNTYYYITNAEYNADSATIAYNTRGTSMSIATRSIVASTAPLPVELTSFTGNVDARNLAVLRWTTASEHNTSYFALERSADGTSFTEVGRVTATGNSIQALGYQWADPQAVAHTTYYRLRQVDHDGTLVYSSVVALSPVSDASRSVEVYPNPSAGQEVKILMRGFDNEAITLHLIDALGRQVVTHHFTATDGHYLTPLSLPQGLPAGTYILSLAGNSSSTQKRIVLSAN
jgi:hypothetical protein